jgi:hypothetical protein
LLGVSTAALYGNEHPNQRVQPPSTATKKRERIVDRCGPADARNYSILQSAHVDKDFGRRILLHPLTMNQHLMGSLKTYEMAGRLLMGLEPLRWMF